MKSQGLVIIAFIFLVGLLAGSFFQLTHWPFIVLIFLFSIAILFLFFPGWKGKGLIFLLLCLAGYFYYGWFDHHNKSQLPEGQVSFQGVVKNTPQFKGDMIRLSVKITEVNKKSVSGGEDILLLIFVKSKEELMKGKGILQSGREIRGTMNLKVPDPPTNPGEFNYPQYLYWKKIHRIGIINNFSNVTFKKEIQWNLFHGLSYVQGFLSQRIDQLYPPESGGLIKSFLLGNTRDLDPEISLVYSHLGLTHILAISGQHIAWVMAGLFLFFRIIGMCKERAIIIIMIILPLYVLLTGASPSALRALIMGELVLISLYFHLFRDGLNLLAFAFLIMVIANPYYIHDIGFQLSFVVTAGLLLLVPLFNRVLPIRIEGVKILISVTLVATMVSFPLIIYHFHVFSFLSLLTNVFCVPLFEFFIAPLGFFSIFLGVITPKAGWLFAQAVDFILTTINTGLNHVEKRDFFRIVLPGPPRIWLFGYIFGLLLFFLLIYSKVCSRRDCWAFFSGIVIFVTVPLIIQDQANTQTVRITFLDVGQGDSIVVEASGIVTVIDTGGPRISGNKEEWQKNPYSFNPSKHVLIPYLYYRGIDKIDALILSHWDSDHIGGVPYLLQHFPVGRVIVNDDRQTTALFHEIQQIISDQHISQEITFTGESWINGPDVRWQVISPKKVSVAENDNDRSLVLLLEAFTRKILLTGDLEEKGEKQILQGDSFWPIDVLKVGHHGSHTSTSEEWIQTLRPDLSVISVGKNNRYGHPNLEVIQRIRKFGGGMERTDQSGAITILIDKEKILYQRHCNNKRIP